MHFPLNVRKGEQTFISPADFIWEVRNSVSHPLFICVRSKQGEAGGESGTDSQKAREVQSFPFLAATSR